VSRVPYPPRIPLAHLPTPLEPLPRLSAALGVRVSVKRDDCTGAVETGNKVRKLEFLAARARAEGCDTLITCGAVQSNHCRATAVVGARLGFRVVLVLRGTPPPVPSGNYFLDRVLGAACVFITPAEWPERAARMAAEAQRVAAAGGRALVIPEGGSDATGAWGYVRAMEELCGQLAAADDRMDVLVHAAGSGGTTAGLALGATWCGFAGTLLAVPVCDDGAYFDGVVQRIAAELRAAGADARPAPVTYVEGYGGPGYGLPDPAGMAWVDRLAREEGIVCDPVYTGKALAGLCGEAQAGRIPRGAHVVFLHTGGVFGALAQPEEYGRP
jgi:D-cysteine desulfhydrase